MTTQLSAEDRRKIENEKLARSANRKIRTVIKDHTPAEEQTDLTIDFFCECSDEACEVRVPLTLDEYEASHADRSKFIVFPGHQTPSVEFVNRHETDYNIVTKPALQ